MWFREPRTIMRSGGIVDRSSMPDILPVARRIGGKGQRT